MLIGHKVGRVPGTDGRIHPALFERGSPVDDEKRERRSFGAPDGKLRSVPTRIFHDDHSDVKYPSGDGGHGRFTGFSMRMTLLYSSFGFGYTADRAGYHHGLFGCFARYRLRSSEREICFKRYISTSPTHVYY